MKKYTKPLFALIILIANSMASASSISQLDLPELLEESELVFEGEVINKEARWNSNQTDILTHITFRVDDVIVGAYTNPNLTLSFIGGTVDGMTVTIEGSEMPLLNETGVYFVNSTTQNLVNPLAGWAQGHFLTQQDANGTTRMMTQSKAPIIGIDMSLKKTNTISEGVMTGVTVSQSSALSLAMTLGVFKDLLKEQASASNIKRQQ